jgi:hypothetical protein
MYLEDLTDPQKYVCLNLKANVLVETKKFI